jgi:hypothetical protein
MNMHEFGLLLSLGFLGEQFVIKTPLTMVLAICSIGDFKIIILQKHVFGHFQQRMHQILTRMWVHSYAMPPTDLEDQNTK